MASSVTTTAGTVTGTDPRSTSPWGTWELGPRHLAFDAVVVSPFPEGTASVAAHGVVPA